jgi:hypothetical protein
MHLLVIPKQYDSVYLRERGYKTNANEYCNLSTQYYIQ